MKQAYLSLLIIIASAGCDPVDLGEGPVTEGQRRVSFGAAEAAGHVDSAVPIDQALRKFRQELAEAKTLQNGSATREKLVRELVRALEARDTSALRRMVLKADEFAWLYYPDSPLSRPPYELPPALMWFQLQVESEKGASRLLVDRGGRPLGYVDHTCAPPRVEGKNLIHPHCELRRLTPAGDTLTERWFGLIVEREGSYKFVSYANRLD